MQNDYNCCIEQIRHLSEQRQASTTIYLSANTAISGAIAFLLKDSQILGLPQALALLLLLIAGIIVCDSWRRLIYQFRILLDWWYEQLRAIEKEQAGTHLYIMEYEALYRAKSTRQLVGLTSYQVRLTWIFTALYIMFGAAIFLSLIHQLLQS